VATPHLTDVMFILRILLHLGASTQPLTLKVPGKSYEHVRSRLEALIVHNDPPAKPYRDPHKALNPKP